MALRNVVYKDKERNILVIHKPSDLYLAFDLSEYSPEEQEYYTDSFKRIHQEYLDAIKELGLSSNYRYFSENKIEWLDDEEE